MNDSDTNPYAPSHLRAEPTGAPRTPTLLRTLGSAVCTIGAFLATTIGMIAFVPLIINDQVFTAFAILITALFFFGGGLWALHQDSSPLD
jgi:hypothetical protein